MKKKILLTIMIGILLVGFVNASLVGFLSNKIEGTVGVLGLNFYANTNSELTVDEPSSNIALTEIGENELAIWEYTLNERMGFYDMNLKLFAQARAVLDDGHETNETQAPVKLEFGYIDDVSKIALCEKNMEINIDENFYEYDTFCEDVNGNFEADGFYYRILSNGENVGYKIQLHEAKTKVEMRGAGN